MKYTYVEINNFKGIEKVRIDFDASPRGNVYTLIGLNESGKTTILEGINLITYREDLDPLDVPGYGKQDVHDLIPIAKRSNFNDKMIIKAGFKLDESDEEQIKEFAKATLNITITEPIGKFEVTQSYEFKNSRVLEGQPQIRWTIKLMGKKRNQKKAHYINAGDEWKELSRKIRTLLPTVLYFPNFLFEIPDKIYLENPVGDSAKHEFYRTVLQDVLDAIDEDINLEDHILTRAKSADAFDKKSLESVLLKMGTHITKTVFQNWNRIFKRPIGNKEIVVNIDRDERGAHYLQLRLKDSSDLFAISERSLGFRWFFTFLLLTHYRGFRSHEPKNVLFLFDEPASNLHPSAQAQLLESFISLPRDCGIIYTTHSHHMIKPEWLEGAFVVKNEGIHYTGTEDDYSARQTLITLHRYREFAATHPNQTTYFQPVLDVLDYSPGRLENVPDVVMLEGKNDFYTLKFMCQQLNKEAELNLLPGNGAGSLTDVIRLYIAWGRNFIVLLDSDKAGDKQKSRYEDVFGCSVKGRIFTLKDIDESWAKISSEKLFNESDRLSIQGLVYPEGTSYNKVHFNRAIQELYLIKRDVNLSQETKDKFEKLISSCTKMLSSNRLC